MHAAYLQAGQGTWSQCEYSYSTNNKLLRRDSLEQHANTTFQVAGLVAII